MQLLSEFVIDLFEMLEIPFDADEHEGKTIEDVLQAQVKIVDATMRPEELMVHLCAISQRIISRKALDEEEALLKPTPE